MMNDDNMKVLDRCRRWLKNQPVDRLIERGMSTTWANEVWGLVDLAATRIAELEAELAKYEDRFSGEVCGDCGLDPSDHDMEIVTQTDDGHSICWLCIRTADVNKQNGILGQDNFDLRARIAELETKLADYDNSMKCTLDEKCGADQKHCGCVPFLRKRIVELERELFEKTASLDRLYGQKFSDRCYYALRSRAEKAEAENAKYVEEIKAFHSLVEEVRESFESTSDLPNELIASDIIMDDPVGCVEFGHGLVSGALRGKLTYEDGLRLRYQNVPPLLEIVREAIKRQRQALPESETE